MTTTDGRAAPLPCAFARALLSRHAACPLAVMALEGEAERPQCASPVANANCATLRAMIRERAGFALRLPAPPAPLPHAAELRLQCGGLAGLAQVVDGAGPRVTDVHDLVRRAGEAGGGLHGVDFRPVVEAVLRWEGRPRASGRQRSP